MRAFVEAAKAFYEAAPWRHLTDEDLIRVEGPAAEPGLAHVTVLGAAGRTFGLGFFQSVDDHEEVRARLEPEAFLEKARWSVFFGPIMEVPFGDADLWEKLGLPVAGADAYPVAIRSDPEQALRRPDAAVLSYLEGLLRALAGTTEEEIDRERWAREVRTYDGPATFGLSIPALLEPPAPPRASPSAGLADRRAMERVMREMERFMARSEFKNLKQANRVLRRRFTGPMDAIPSTASTPLEKAQDLAYQAFEARGRRRVQLARKALELSTDCADAYTILAEHAWELERARDLYAQGVSAASVDLGLGSLRRRLAISGAWFPPDPTCEPASVSRNAWSGSARRARRLTTTGSSSGSTRTTTRASVTSFCRPCSPTATTTKREPS